MALTRSMVGSNLFSLIDSHHVIHLTPSWRFILGLYSALDDDIIHYDTLWQSSPSPSNKLTSLQSISVTMVTWETALKCCWGFFSVWNWIDLLIFPPPDVSCEFRGCLFHLFWSALPHETPLSGQNVSPKANLLCSRLAVWPQFELR